MVEGYGSVGIISVSLGKVSCQKQGFCCMSEERMKVLCQWSVLGIGIRSNGDPWVMTQHVDTGEGWMGVLMGT